MELKYGTQRRIEVNGFDRILHKKRELEEKMTSLNNEIEVGSLELPGALKMLEQCYH